MRTDISQRPFPYRLQQIGAAAEALIEQFKPDAVALEEIFFGKNEKTGIQIAEVRGILTYLAMSKGLACTTTRR